MTSRNRRPSADPTRRASLRRLRAAAGIATAALALLGLPSPSLSEAAPDAELRLELNLPARRLDVSVYGETLQSYVVAIGGPAFPTPVGSFEITRIVWNPWWYPPPSEWAADEEITPPCPTNPMGRVKLYYRDLYFIHGTPDTESLGRAVSHGCVRMASDEVVALARLVHSYGVPGADEAEIDRLVGEPESTRHVTLERPVPLDVVYRIAEVRKGDLLLHPDVYRRIEEDWSDQILSTLARAGFQRGEIDLAAIESLVDSAPRPGEPTLVVPLEALLLPESERSKTEGSSR